MTAIQITPMQKDVKPDGAYVYLHHRSDAGSVMYVGKGRRGRWLSKNGRGVYWINSARLHGVSAEVLQDGLSDEAAMLLEMWLIAKFRHEGMSLVNQTEGGEGASGFKQSEETKELRASKMRGPLHPFYGKKMSEEHCRNLSVAHIGKMKGRESSTASLKIHHFRHIDGRHYHGIMSEFREYSGLNSGGVSRIVNGGRKHEKGWYVSEKPLCTDFIMNRGVNSFYADQNVYSIVNKDGVILTGRRQELRSKTGANQSHFDAVIRGDRRSHLGWRLYNG